MTTFNGMKKISLAVTVILLVGFFSWYKVQPALAACSAGEPQESNTLTGVTPSSGSFSNPSSIFVNASGQTVFICNNSTGYRDTSLDWEIKNSSGTTMATGSWSTPQTWTNPIAGGAVNYDGSNLGFTNGYPGENVNVSAWPAGTYTLIYRSVDDTPFNVGSTKTLSSSFSITRPSTCILSATCVANANTTDTLTVITTNCSSASIDGSAINPTNGTYINGNKTYGIYAVKADSTTSNVTCPAQPSLSVSGGGNMTVTPGQDNTSPDFNFSNNGDTGSQIDNAKCSISSTSGITNPSSNVKTDCSSPRNLVK